MEILKASKLGFGFKSGFGTEKPSTIFQPLSFQVKAGEWIAIVGPSGVGKSTFLRLLAGLLNPQSGTLEWNLKNPQQPFGFVFQEPHLMPWKTVEENIALAFLGAGARLDRAGGADQKAVRIGRVKTWIEKVRLQGAEQKFPHELSGGMRMRASFARAAVASPEVLFFDEPFSALDEKLRMELGGLMHQEWIKRNREGNALTCFFVTHSISEAVLWSNKLFVLEPFGKGTAKLNEIPIQLSVERSFDLYRSAEYFSELQRVYGELKRWIEVLA